MAQLTRVPDSRYEPLFYDSVETSVQNFSLDESRCDYIDTHNGTPQQLDLKRGCFHIMNFVLFY